MFRHLVVTGRSRLALYLARIPAGLAIVVAAGGGRASPSSARCASSRAPTKLNYQGVNGPRRGCLAAGFETWADEPSDSGHLRLPYNETDLASMRTVRDRPGWSTRSDRNRRSTRTPTLSPSLHRAPSRLPSRSPAQDYADYTKIFLYPSISLMIETGLWIELEAAIGFIVGLGLGIAHRAANGAGDPDDRARDHPDADLLKSGDPSPGQSATRAGGIGHGSPRTERASIWGRRWTGRPGWIGAPLRVDHSGGLRHRGLARGMDCPRHVADGAQRRLIRSLGDPQHHHHHRVQVIDASHGSRFAPSPVYGAPRSLVSSSNGDQRVEC